MKALVLDGNQRSSLAVVRSLGGARVPVTVGESSSSSLAASSRYCRNTLCYPSPLFDAASFLAFLMNEVQRGEYRVMYPMTDISVRLVARERAALARHVCLPIPDEEQILVAQDKLQVLELARGLDIPCPETYMTDEGESIEEIALRINYPAVIKPRFSKYEREGAWVDGQVQYAHNPEELISKYRESSAVIPRPLVQARVVGEGRGVFLLVWGGELKAAFSHRRLREKPPWGGVSVYSESVPLNEGLVKKSLALLRAIGWHGPAMVEYKLDKRDGQEKLMEVNGRFWGSLQLAVDAGVDFPLIIYRLASGEHIAPQFDYKVGVKSRWFLGDLDHLLIRLRSREGRNGLANQGHPKLRAFLDFLKLYEPNLYYEVLRLGDMRPGWVEFEKYIKESFRRLRG